ncbi:hypothetical protein [Pseudomonas luteola]|uniref:IS256 family transposase n=1 Tax=Pseudomonas luteola TaxID=47886 RepID=A0ABS0MUV1_PSELU|nr:hypothetical protein [Pseudomonas luteola]MBH3440498.1 hypothetical protein [Pseudomonas luteola]
MKVKVSFPGEDPVSKMLQDAIEKAQGNPLLDMALKRLLEDLATAELMKLKG